MNSPNTALLFRSMRKNIYSIKYLQHYFYSFKNIYVSTIVLKNVYRKHHYSVMVKHQIKKDEKDDFDVAMGCYAITFGFSEIYSYVLNSFHTTLIHGEEFHGICTSQHLRQITFSYSSLQNLFFLLPTSPTTPIFLHQSLQRSCKN